MPNFSCSTFTTGARQLVVQEAFDTTLCLAGSYMPLLTPSTMVTSSFEAGAEMITFFTDPCRCLAASLASVKWPVDSTTICAPTEVQSNCAGSLKKVIISAPASNED